MQYVTMVVYGVAAHAILLMSVFDVYFRSPILPGIEPASRLMRYRAPARRVVLFLADGLRADKCFGLKKPSATTMDTVAEQQSLFVAPYLRSIAESEGVWGVSHTRVPTESRPGTVALVSGLYEDVSAITRGWKENPVKFDSIFNESRHSFCWGSPDTLSMFPSALGGGDVYADSYDQNLVDFGAEDPSSLDMWVFDKFTRFLIEAERNETLKQLLSHDGIVFFFHLLGADISGHTRKPWSPEYARTVSIVDEIVNKTVSLMRNYFGADHHGTTYLFTADHGMTDWGSHGSSDTEETETPFLAWGAGIRKPLIEFDADHRRSNYDLNSIRHDINQADVAPLMATLIGIPIPVNSVGILPDEILDCWSDWCTEALIANAMQLAAQLQRHWELKDSSIFFRPLKGFSKLQLKAELESLSSGTGTSSREAAKRLMKTLLIGIRYFETYDRFSLCVCVSFGFLGWMYFVVLHLMKTNDRINNGRIWEPMSKFVLIVIVTLMVSLSYIQSEPLSYYVYRLFPVVTWALVFNSKRVLWCETLSPLRIQWDVILRRSVCVLGLTLALELLVFTFFRREALAIGLFLIGFYPKLHNRRSINKCGRSSAVSWLVVCTLMSTYAIWTPIGASANNALVCLAGVACITIVCAAIYSFKSSVFADNELVMGIQLAILCATLLNRMLVALYHGDHTWAWLIRMTSWILLTTCNFVPLFGESHTRRRLFGLSVSLATSYLLLSYAHEALLCILFLLLLGLWWFLEYEWLNDPSITMPGPGPRNDSTVSGQLNWDDVRLAYFSLFLTMLAFFGLGNVSNVNSFSLDSVFPFVTVFSPYTMGALLLWKVLCPFLAVACYVHAVHETRLRSQVNPLYVVLLLCDLMALQFFYMVRDEGSWLEIGTSLGHFVIAIMTTIGFAVLHLVAKVMMNLTLNCTNWPRGRKTHSQ